MQDSFIYKLASPIEVAKDGKSDSSDEVIVMSPRPKDRVFAMKLESILGKALLNFDSGKEESKASEEKETNEEDKIKGWELLILSGLDEDKIEPIIYNLGELMCAGNLENPQSTVGDVKFTKPLYEMLSAKDIKALIPRYAVNFLFSDLI